jgi:hypothetical protein
MSYIGQKPADKLVTSSDMEDGIVTTAKIADSSVTTEKIVADTNFRNIIINGDMSIAQRGTTFTGNTASNYMVDRFIQNINGTFGTWTNGQETDAPANTGFQKSLFMNCTTADDAPSAADFVRVEQRFEGQMLQYLKKGTSSAESLTLSFWVKSPKTGTHIAELEDRDNSRYVSQSYTINAANTWEFKTATFPGDTTGTLNNDNGESLRLNFYLGAGTDWSSGTLGTTWHTTAANRAAGQVNVGDAIHSSGNYWQITGVQLEAGTTASDFEFLPVDVNLERCYRYCYRINGNATDEQQAGFGGWSPGNNTINSVFSFSPPLRAVPTVTESALKDTATDAAISLTGIFDDNQSGLCNTLGVSTQADSGTPFTTNYPAFIRLSASTSAFIQFDSEL